MRISSRLSTNTPWVTRMLYDFFRIWRERMAVRASQQRFGYARLNYRRIPALTGKPSARRLFILGTGASVEDLSNRDFNFIGESLSVGMNTWPLHWFVPDMYGLEDFEAVGFENERNAISAALGRAAATKKNPVVLYLRSHSWTSNLQHIVVPQALKHRTFTYGRITVAAKSMALVEQELGTLVKLGMHGWLPRDLTLDTGASIVRMVSLGMFLGMKEIVLVGVDLNSTEYFFQRNPDHLARHGLGGFDTRQNGQLHDTMNTDGRRYNVYEFLLALSAVSQANAGPKIFVASENSLLADFLPVFPWDR